MTGDEMTSVMIDPSVVWDTVVPRVVTEAGLLRPDLVAPGDDAQPVAADHSRSRA
jgi:hypothetical protein